MAMKLKEIKYKKPTHFFIFVKNKRINFHL